MLGSDSLWLIDDLEEDLVLGSGTRLDHSELLCGISFIIVKMDKESF